MVVVGVMLHQFLVVVMVIQMMTVVPASLDDDCYQSTQGVPSNEEVEEGTRAHMVAGSGVQCTERGELHDRGHG